MSEHNEESSRQRLFINESCNMSSPDSEVEQVVDTDESSEVLVVDDD